MYPFGTRLAHAMAARGPLCVGIDPHPALLSRWGLPDTVPGLTTFCRTVAEALADRAPVVKPQSAFFERFGSAGIAVLESTIRRCREAGALVLLDVKRGDVGSTAQAYGQAYLDPTSPLLVDALTVHPYLGFASLAPILDQAEAHDGGVFVVTLGSDPEGQQLQTAVTGDGRTVAQTLIDDVSRRNEQARPLGSIGVVIGATVGVTGHDLSQLNGPVLAPGVGAQGGQLADLPARFAGLNGVVLPSSSREILGHGPSVTGLRQAYARSLTECRKVLNYPV
jgi:orotidine-5'-phosphate decarboxylase